MLRVEEKKITAELKKLYLAGAMLACLSLVPAGACSSVETVTTTGPETTEIFTQTVMETQTAVPITVTVTVSSYRFVFDELNLTQAQVYAIAANLVPPSVLGGERVVTVFSDSPGPHRWWLTSFSALHGYLTSKQELLAFGWQADANTTFGDTESYAQVEIIVDGETGEVIHKTAFNGFKIGGLPVIKS
jgi:hypothetical protein